MLWYASLLLTSLLVLTLGAELLVRGAVSIAARSGLSPVFIGLTVLGFGTSTPELCTSVLAGIQGLEHIAVGNVVGSNIFNIAVILGLAALVHPIVVEERLIRKEVWVVMAVATVPFVALLSGGRLGRLFGAVMVLGLATYVWQAFKAGRSAQKEQEDRPVPPARSSGSLTSAALVVAGLAALAGGSQLLVVSASHLAGGLGMSELTIGLTIVAAGTSAPELVTSLVAAYRGQTDLAVGNIFGSNVFNLLGVLGLTCLVHPQAVAPQTLVLDAPVMLLASLAMLPIMRSGGRISRLEGALLALSYVVYVTLLLTVVPSWFST